MGANMVRRLMQTGTAAWSTIEPPPPCSAPLGAEGAAGATQLDFVGEARYASSG